MAGEEWIQKEAAKEAALKKRREEAKENMTPRVEKTVQAQKPKELEKPTPPKSELEKKQEVAMAEARKQRLAAENYAIDQLKQSSMKLNAVRTLKTDLADEAKKSHSITASIIKHRNKSHVAAEEVVGQARHRWLSTLLTLLFLTLSGGASYYIYLYYYLPYQPGTSSAPNSSSPRQFIPTDKQVRIEIADARGQFLDRREILKRLGALIDESLPGGGALEQLIPTKANREIGIEEFLEIVKDPTATRTLHPWLSQSFVFGRYKKGDDETVIFLILKASDQNTAFQGMREWEPELPKLFLNITGRQKFSISTDTNFKSEFFLNLEARDWQGKLTYIFLDPTTIVITSSESALAEIIDRQRQT